MDTIGIVLLSVLASSVGVFVVLKYVLHWVNVEKIPEDAIEKAAKNLLKDKFEETEKELEELKEKEENRLRERRRE